jgi:catechol 2,3-dioxygenase-like lactoylglutathione lyase family enzyme
MTATSTTSIRPSLHHVTMKTSDLDEMIEWYGLVLGMQVQFRNEVAAWTSNDEANHRTAFLAAPGLGDDADKIHHNGMHHCAFEYASFADLMSSYDRLRKSDVEPAFRLDHGMTMSIYYEDPMLTMSNCEVTIFPIGSFQPSTRGHPGHFPKIRPACFSIRRASTRAASSVPISRRCRKMSALAVICPSKFHRTNPLARNALRAERSKWRWAR